MTALVIGADANGGSIKCAALAASREGRPLLADMEVASTLTWDLTTPSETAAVELQSALMQLVNQLSASTTEASTWQLLTVCVGTPAADTADEAERLRSALASRLPATVQVLVYSSAAVALAAGTGGSLLGCVLVAGLDSSRAYGAVADHRATSAAGWGPVFSDGGCAYDLGARALAAVSRATDGRGADTQLVEGVKQHLGVQRAEDLIRWARNHQSIPQRVAGVAGLASVVLMAASRGDTVADAILRNAAGELMRSVKAVAVRLGLDQRRQPFPLVLTGAMLGDGNLLQHYLLDALRDAVPLADVVYPLTNNYAEAAGWLACWRLNPQHPLPPLRRSL